MYTSQLVSISSLREPQSVYASRYAQISQFKLALVWLLNTRSMLLLDWLWKGTKIYTDRESQTKTGERSIDFNFVRIL